MTHNAKLNRLLIELHRSLLQYASESSLWSPDPRVREELHHAAERRHVHIAAIIELLTRRRWVIEFGRYPADLSEMHFLSFDFLLPQLLEAQDRLVDELDEAVHTCVDDVEAVSLLEAVLHGERMIEGKLRALAPRPADALPRS